MHGRIKWPEGKKFAFTIFDDTDLATLTNVPEVYACLYDNGFRTTKSVWPIHGNKTPVHGGLTCEDTEYLNWLYSLERQGFEIGLHNATFHSSVREDTIRGIERFNNIFGYYPKSMANHASCKEGIYWGNYRLSGWYERIYNLILRNRHKDVYRGHVEGDQFFWGDICKQRIKYVRNFVFGDINTYKMCPIMPYHDPQRAYVNYWYASSEGGQVDVFNKTISEQNQDRLEEEGGVCIMYTHLACGFYQDGQLNSRFKSLIKRLGEKDGWFVPVSALLDYLLGLNGNHVITDTERSTLEKKWLLHKMRVGRT